MWLAKGSSVVVCPSATSPPATTRVDSVVVACCKMNSLLTVLPAKELVAVEAVTPAALVFVHGIAVKRVPDEARELAAE